MTELNRLLALDVLSRVPAGAHDLCAYPQRGNQNKDGAENCSARQVIRAVAENLWHLCPTEPACCQADGVVRKPLRKHGGKIPAANASTKTE
jgi:hypothetical protein